MNCRNSFRSMSISSKNQQHVFETSKSRNSPECSATGMGQFPIYKLKWDLLRTSVTACTIGEDTLSAPFGIFYVRTKI